MPSADNFKVEIQVQDDSADKRNKAFAEALKQILFQSGIDVNSLNSSSSFKTKLNNSVNYVRSYSYLTKTNMLGKPEKFLVYNLILKLLKFNQSNIIKGFQ